MDEKPKPKMRILQQVAYTIIPIVEAGIGPCCANQGLAKQ